MPEPFIPHSKRWEWDRTRERAAWLPPSPAYVSPARERARVVELLQIAYARPCLLCGKQGPCAHREPEVELALMLRR